MADLRDLYQEVILEHSKAPRNYRELAGHESQGRGLQPAVRRSVHGLCRDGGRLDSRHRLPGLGLRDLQGFGVDDDAEPEGQDAGGSAKKCSSSFTTLVTGQTRRASSGIWASWRYSPEFRSFRCA